MWRLLKAKVNLGFIVNPFYLYCAAFSLAFFVYLWGWSSIFPELSAGLMLFFAVSSILFIFAGYKLWKKDFVPLNRTYSHHCLNDIIFWLIIFLGFVNVLFMGYLPFVEQSNNYKEFGMPVIDPVFNTLCIFFSVCFFHSYLEYRKGRFLLYIFIILIIQVLLFRRSTIVWIITSSSFLFLFYKREIKLIIILAGILCIPLFSYCFGLYGNTRSNLTKSIVLNDLGASESFKNSGISYNHYIPYLYVSSPLANLQKNIDESKGFFNNSDLKDFFFYCLLPQSLTIRLERSLNLAPPDCSLITPDLIVGSFFMVSFYTLGWAGMIIMLLFLFAFIFLCLIVIKKWDTFSVATYAILSTTITLLIFSNFLNRLDIILMLFVYPVFFHIIFKKSRKVQGISNRFPRSGLNDQPKTLYEQ